jgi:hypothetical protein
MPGRDEVAVHHDHVLAVAGLDRLIRNQATRIVPNGPGRVGCPLVQLVQIGDLAEPRLVGAPSQTTIAQINESEAPAQHDPSTLGPDWAFLFGSADTPPHTQVYSWENDSSQVAGDVVVVGDGTEPAVYTIAADSA